MKVSKENLVLHLPFDEEVGSTRAYNFAPNHTTDNDALLSGNCELTEDAVFGNALQMNDDTAECAVSQNLIDFSGEFTITAFLRTSASELTFLMNFGNGGLSQSHTVAIVPLRWYFVAIQHLLVNGTYYTRFILDEQLLFNEVSTGTPMGCSVADNGEGASIVAVDDLHAYNRGLSLSEVFSLEKENDDVEYYVDGENFKLYGVEVSKSEGLVDALERKEPLRVDWDSMHGEVIDLQRPHWQRREITLECFIVASNNTAFIRALKNFMAAFEKAGTQRLTCEYAGSVKPLEYDVYRNDKVEVDKTWNDELMVGTFTLALIEPQPVKMVLKHICQTSNSQVWFECHSDKMLNVSWGDGDTHCRIYGETSDRDRSNNIRSRNSDTVKVLHTYAAPGEYDIVIHGNIEEITNFSTNAIVIWSKL